MRTNRKVVELVGPPTLTALAFVVLIAGQSLVGGYSLSPRLMQIGLCFIVLSSGLSFAYSAAMESIFTSWFNPRSWWTSVASTFVGACAGVVVGSILWLALGVFYGPAIHSHDLRPLALGLVTVGGTAEGFVLGLAIQIVASREPNRQT